MSGWSAGAATVTGSAVLTRTDFGLLLAAVFAISLGYGVVLPVLPSFLGRLVTTSGSLSWHTGMLSAAYMVALFIAAPLWGRIADRIGRRPVILTGLAGFSAALLVFGFAAELWLGYLARVAAGAFAAGVLPVTLAYVGDTREASRARRFAWMSAASVGGFVGGPSLGGWLAGAAPDGALSPAALPLAAAAAVGMLVWSGLWWRLRAPASVRAALVAGRPPAHLTRPLLLLTLLVMYGLGAFEVGVTLLGQDAFALTPADFGLLFLECSLVMAAVNALLFAPLADRLAGRGTAAMAFLAMAIGVGWLVTATGLDGLGWRVGLIAGSAGLLGPLLTYRLSLAAGGAQATTLGAQTSAGSLGQALGSIAAGWLYGAIGEMSFWVTAALLVAAAGLALSGGHGSSDGAHR